MFTVLSETSPAPLCVLDQPESAELESPVDAQIGQLLRAARVRAGLSQARLAGALSCAQSLVCAWERGEVRVPVAQLVEVARHLQVVPLALLPLGLLARVPPGGAAPAEG